MGQRTYWHLAEQRRIPSRYDVTSSRLLYSKQHGHAIDTPASRWFGRYQQSPKLSYDQWHTFKDPRQTTYSSYVELQQRQEHYVQGLLDAADGAGHDAGISNDWLDVLEHVVPTLRYPCQGLHMVSAYCGHLAPEGKLVIAFAFQTADELRRIQKLAYRMRQLRELRPSFGETSLASWQDDPAWQPLRRTLERLLVTYDFSEAWVAFNVVMKPAFDALFVDHFAQLCRHRGDPVTAQLLQSLKDDCEWHKSWTRELCLPIAQGSASDREALQGWVHKWWKMTGAWLAAVTAPWAVADAEREQLFERVRATCMAYWATLNIEVRAA
jgi:toluene monooxygenase system protein E